MAIDDLFDLLDLTDELSEEAPAGTQPTCDDGSSESSPCWCPD